MFMGIGLSCISLPLFALPLCFGFMLFLITQLTDIGGYTDYVGSGWDRILDGLKKVHQFQLVSLLPCCKPD